MDEQNSCTGFSCTWNYLQVREDGLEFFTVCNVVLLFQRNVGTVLVHEDFASCNNIDSATIYIKWVLLY